MNSRNVPGRGESNAQTTASQLFSFSMARPAISDTSSRQAELFYLQKQIQAQTPMVVMLENGERVEGCIEWYDRQCIKLRGRTKTLVYKSAIKYMYKLGE
jgi:RNA chaperone Hfq